MAISFYVAVIQNWIEVNQYIKKTFDSYTRKKTLARQFRCQSRLGTFKNIFDSIMHAQHPAMLLNFGKSVSV